MKNIHKNNNIFQFGKLWNPTKATKIKIEHGNSQDTNNKHSAYCLVKNRHRHTHTDKCTPMVLDINHVTLTSTITSTQHYMVMSSMDLNRAISLPIFSITEHQAKNNSALSKTIFFFNEGKKNSVEYNKEKYFFGVIFKISCSVLVVFVFEQQQPLQHNKKIINGIQFIKIILNQ